jgi:hypothetical protein
MPQQAIHRVPLFGRLAQADSKLGDGEMLSIPDKKRLTREFMRRKGLRAQRCLPGITAKISKMEEGASTRMTGGAFLFAPKFTWSYQP